MCKVEKWKIATRRRKVNLMSRNLKSFKAQHQECIITNSKKAIIWKSWYRRRFWKSRNATQMRRIPGNDFQMPARTTRWYARASAFPNNNRWLRQLSEIASSSQAGRIPKSWISMISKTMLTKAIHFLAHKKTTSKICSPKYMIKFFQCQLISKNEIRSIIWRWLQTTTTVKTTRWWNWIRQIHTSLIMTRTFPKGTASTINKSIQLRANQACRSKIQTVGEKRLHRSPARNRKHRICWNLKAKVR